MCVCVYGTDKKRPSWGNLETVLNYCRSQRRQRKKNLDKAVKKGREAIKGTSRSELCFETEDSSVVCCLL